MYLIFVKLNFVIFHDSSVEVDMELFGGKKASIDVRVLEVSG